MGLGVLERSRRRGSRGARWHSPGSPSRCCRCRRRFASFVPHRPTCTINKWRWDGDSPRVCPSGRVCSWGMPGAIPYVARRGAIDALGLGGFARMPFVRAAVEGEAATVELLEHLAPSERPEMLALYPNWFAATTAAFGHEVDRVTIDGNVICGGPTKVIVRGRLERARRARRRRPVGRGARRHRPGAACGDRHARYRRRVQTNVPTTTSPLPPTAAGRCSRFTRPTRALGCSMADASFPMGSTNGFACGPTARRRSSPCAARRAASFASFYAAAARKSNSRPPQRPMRAGPLADVRRPSRPRNQRRRRG